MSMSDSSKHAKVVEHEEDSSPQEMDRDELEEEVTCLREDVDFLESRLWDLEEAVLGDAHLGRLSTQINHGEEESILTRVENVESGGGAGVKLAGDREQMLPGHRMYGDMRTGADASLNDTQKRAARIWGLFIERAVEDEPNKVDPTGQQYTIKSGEVQEALLGGEDEENLLEGVKEKSWSQTSARVMRDVARLSKFDECDCETVDDCTHAAIRFHRGRPHKLAAPKNLFHTVMGNVYGGGVGNADDEDVTSSEATTAVVEDGGAN